MRIPLEGHLWKHPDFLRFWLGETVSLVGTQVTRLALPTLAILTLNAGAFQIGILRALQSLSFLLLAAVVGVWIDRLHRRRLMIVADLGQAILLATIPVAFLIHALTLIQVFVVAALSGIFAVAFDVAHESYVPMLIDREDLIEANTKIQTTGAAAFVGGPSLGGFLIQVIGPALAIGADVTSFLVSAVSLALIRRERISRQPAGPSAEHFMGQLAEGLRVMVRDPILRTLAACAATSNFAGSMLQAVLLLFAYQQLHLTPAQVGVVFGISAIGGVLGALSGMRILRVLGLGRALALIILFDAVADLAIPTARLGAAMVVLTALFTMISVGEPVWRIGVGSLRQAVIPDHLRGRVIGSIRTVTFGAIPVGSLVGGALGSSIGIVSTILLSGVVTIGAALWILTGPVFGLKEIPTPAHAT